MSEDVLARLADVLKDEHNAYTRATAIHAQGEIIRLSEKLRRQHDETQRLTAALAAERARAEKAERERDEARRRLSPESD